MKSKRSNPVGIPVCSKIIGQLSEVENFIEHTTRLNSDPQLTLLLKLGQHYQDNGPEARERYATLKAYWKKLLGASTDFGFFYNAEIGTIFIAGPLSEVFLYAVKHKKLGELSGGPYGILRGLGITEKEAATQIKNLNEGRYLVLIKRNLSTINLLKAYSKKLNMAG
jgi:hypothetical protein